MGEGLISVIVVCATSVIITLIVAYVKITARQMDKTREVAPSYYEAEEALSQPTRTRSAQKSGISGTAYALGTEPKGTEEEDDSLNVMGWPHYTYSKDEKKWNVVPEHSGGLAEDEFYDTSSMAPIPIDPMNKPYPKVYSPRPDSPHEPPRCVCHNRPLKAGQTVLMWPLPNSKAIKIFCRKEGE